MLLLHALSRPRHARQSDAPAPGWRGPLSLGLAAWMIVALTGLSGCQGPAEAARGAAPRKPTTVGVVEARTQSVPILAQSIGTTRALDEVSIRPRVSGYLVQAPLGPAESTAAPAPAGTDVEATRVTVHEGQQVQRGDLLFVIDEAPYKTAVQAAEARALEAQAAVEKAQQSKAREVAQAQLEVDQAQRALAKVEEAREQALVRRNAASPQDLDRAVANREKSEATVAADEAALAQAKVDYDINIQSAQATLKRAEADLEQARLDLGYCRIKAPIDGRLGAAQVKVGNLVGNGAGLAQTELASIQRLDPMGLDVQVSSRFLSSAQRVMARKTPVRLARSGPKGTEPYPHEGQFFFIDNRIDPATSTFLMRVSVPNPEHLLLPGEYVKVETQVDVLNDAVVVPEQALVQTQAGPTVYVVDDKGVVASVLVESSEYTYQGQRIIDSGLNPGQKVIVEGLQQVRPGMTVTPEVVTPTLKTGVSAMALQPGAALPAGANPGGAPVEAPAPARPDTPVAPATPAPAPAGSEPARPGA